MKKIVIAVIVVLLIVTVALVYETINVGFPKSEEFDLQVKTEKSVKLNEKAVIKVWIKNTGGKDYSVTYDKLVKMSAAGLFQATDYSGSFVGDTLKQGSTLVESYEFIPTKVGTYDIKVTAAFKLHIMEGKTKDYRIEKVVKLVVT